MYFFINFIISILISTFSFFKNWGKYITNVSIPTCSTHLSKHNWHSFFIDWFLSDKFGIKLNAIIFVHGLNSFLRHWINLLTKDINILTKFLLLSDNLFFIKLNKSFKPLGNIFILASFNIFSIVSHASFFSIHFPSDKSFNNWLVNFLEISTGPTNSNSTLCLFFIPSKFSDFSFFFTFFFFFDSFFSITVTFSSSASIIFKVDSLISFINTFTSSPTYLYMTQIKFVADVLTCGLEFPAIYLQKLIISFIGKSFTSKSSTILLKSIEYSFNILTLFFFRILEIKFDINELRSIIDSSMLVFINSTILSFSLISAIFS